ncbi:MAG: hypothetical protein AAF658_21550, partial [Myxococcota bacterium]
MQVRYRFAWVAAFNLVACGSGESDGGSTACSDTEQCPLGFICNGGVCESDSDFQDGVSNGNGNANDNDNMTSNANDNDNANNTNGNSNGNDNANSNDNSNDNSVVIVDDLVGPILQIESPAALELAESLATITVSVDDPVGIDIDSVRATIGRENGTDRIEVQLGGVELPMPEGDEAQPLVVSATFSGTFDVSRLPPIIFPFITVRAEDMFGNQTEVGHSFAVDQVAPAVGFYDEMVVYESLEDGCSQAFMATGADNLRHGMVSRPSTTMNPLGSDEIATTFPIRVRIEDQGNGVLVGDENAFSVLFDIDPTATKLYILDQAAISAGATMFASSGDSCVIDPEIRPQGLMREV